MKEWLGRGNAHQNIGQLGACRLTTDGYAPGVAAEGADVLLYPRERSHQVIQPIVGCSRVSLTEQGFAIQEAEDTKPIGDRDAEDTFAGEVGAVVQGIEGEAAGEASSMNPDKDREGPATFRRPDVEVEAVFAVRHFQVRRLHGRGRKARCVAFASPWGYFLRRKKAKWPYWRLGKGNATEDADPVRAFTTQASAGRADHGRRGGRKREKSAGRESTCGQPGVSKKTSASEHLNLESK